MRSVLRISDQVAGRIPDRCVLTGEATEHVLRVRAVSDALPEPVVDVVGGPLRLGRPVDVPMAPEALSDYRRRQSRWVGVAGAGIGLVVLGVLSGAVPWPGLLLLAVAVAGSARLRARRWIQVRQRRDSDDLVVLRAHPAFDEQARRLYTSRFHGGA